MARVNKKSATVSIGATEYKLELVKAEIHVNDAESNVLTFGDAALGGAKVWTLETEFVVDMAAGSLWRKIWDAPGSNATIVFRNYGNAAASTSQPHMTGYVQLKFPSGRWLGGEASADAGDYQTVECTFTWVDVNGNPATPTFVTA